MFVSSFRNLPQGDITTAEKHFTEPFKNSDTFANMLIWYRIALINAWKPGEVLAAGCGYAYVSTENDELFWLPSSSSSFKPTTGTRRCK